MDAINFFKFVEEKYPKYSWESVKEQQKNRGEEIPLEDEGGGLINGKKSGVFVAYGVNHDGERTQYIRKKLTYKDGNLNGPFSEYSENGDIVMKGNFKKGNYDGELMTLLQTHKSISQYKDGIMNGKQTNYYHNGVIKSETNYVGGRKVGEEISYDKEGRIHGRVSYNKNGFRDGPFEIYHNNGKISMKGEYHDGTPISAVLYDVNGVVSGELPNWMINKMDY